MARASKAKGVKPSSQLVQIQRPQGDGKLVHTVDAAFAAVARKSGDWLVCRPGCTQCCHGPFPISQLDVARLRHGLEQLAQSDPRKASAIRARARRSAARLAADFPGDVSTGVLSEDEEAIERFEDFADHEPCPVLSVDGAGRCELYAARPMTCRVFGPPIRSEGPTIRSEGPPVHAVHMSSEHHDDALALGHCELCYHGATPEEIAACELDPHTDELEEKLNRDAEKRSGTRGRTIIAFALR